MHKRKKAYWLMAFLIVFAFFLAACSGKSSSDDENGNGNGNNDGGNGGEQGNGDDTTAGGDLIILSQSEAVTLDPQMATDVPSSNVSTNIYDTLVTFDENMNIVGSLAEEFKQVDDTTWEFKLRSGVKFHDGSDLTADDVVATFNRVLDPNVGSPRAFLYEMITNVEAVDELTVRFTLEYPFAPFPAHLAHEGGSILSEESIQKDYEEMAKGETAGAYIGTNPIGTGYFKLEQWEPGDYLKLVRNDDYWGEKAKLDSVTFRVVDEALTRIAELEVDNAHIIEPLNPSNMAQVENIAHASVYKRASLSLAYIGFNMEKEPFNDVRVRQAISHAIDKTQILEGIYEGTGVPAVGPLAPDVWGYDPSVKPLEYDLEKAKSLLAEAGYADGFSTTIWTNDNPDRMKMAEYVQAALKELNIEVKIEVMEWGTYLAQTAAGNHDMFILGWSTATADADYATYPLFHSSNVGEPGNRTFTKDAELDKILEEARVETDETKRKELYRQAQEKLVEIAPMIYLLHTDLIVGVNDKVQGFSISPSGMFQLKDVTLKE